MDPRFKIQDLGKLCAGTLHTDRRSTAKPSNRSRRSSRRRPNSAFPLQRFTAVLGQVPRTSFGGKMKNELRTRCSFTAPVREPSLLTGTIFEHCRSPCLACLSAFRCLYSQFSVGSASPSGYTVCRNAISLHALSSRVAQRSVRSEIRHWPNFGMRLKPDSNTGSSIEVASSGLKFNTRDASGLFPLP